MSASFDSEIYYAMDKVTGAEAEQCFQCYGDNAKGGCIWEI